MQGHDKIARTIFEANPDLLDIWHDAASEKVRVVGKPKIVEIFFGHGNSPTFLFKDGILVDHTPIEPGAPDVLEVFCDYQLVLMQVGTSLLIEKTQRLILPVFEMPLLEAKMQAIELQIRGLTAQLNQLREKQARQAQNAAA